MVEIQALREEQRRAQETQQQEIRALREKQRLSDEKQRQQLEKLMQEVKVVSQPTPPPQSPQRKRRRIITWRLRRPRKTQNFDEPKKT